MPGVYVLGHGLHLGAVFSPMVWLTVSGDILIILIAR
jgi:hypothetical protein